MRRKRVSLSSEQREFLNRYFLYNDKPSVDEKYDISIELNMSYKAVQIWFQNARAHIRRYQKARSFLAYSSDINDSGKEFFAHCNALCIQPKKSLVKKYLEMYGDSEGTKCERKQHPQIVSTYDPASQVYFLGYW